MSHLLFWELNFVGKLKQGKLEAEIPRPKKVDLYDTDGEDVDKCEPDDYEEDFDVEIYSLIWTWKPSLWLMSH